MCWLVCGGARQSPGILWELQRGKRRLPGLERAADRGWYIDCYSASRAKGRGRGWCWAGDWLPSAARRGERMRVATLNCVHSGITGRYWEWRWFNYSLHKNKNTPAKISLKLYHCRSLCLDVWRLGWWVDAPLLGTHSGTRTQDRGGWPLARGRGFPGVGDWRHRDRAQSDETSDTGVTCGGAHHSRVTSGATKVILRQQVNS